MATTQLEKRTTQGGLQAEIRVLFPEPIQGRMGVLRDRMGPHDLYSDR